MLILNRSILGLGKKMKAAKEEWIEEQCKKIEKGMVSRNSKKAHGTLKALTKTQQRKSAVIEDSSGKVLTDNTAVLNQWTEHCSGLYNYELHPDTSLFQSNQTPTQEAESLPVLREEVEMAVRSLKAGKSSEVDNTPSELLKNGGEATTTVLTATCQKIWETKGWPKEWTQSLIIPLPKKGNLKQCQNYRIISLISHPSKIMLRVILNRLKPKAEELLAEVQASFRPGRSTAEQIFNSRVIVEKHIQNQRSLFHNFKKAFDRVWVAGLWQVLRCFNIEEGLVQAIQALYENTSSAVLLNSQLGEFFKTIVGVRQGCFC